MVSTAIGPRAAEPTLEPLRGMGLGPEPRVQKLLEGKPWEQRLHPAPGAFPMAAEGPGLPVSELALPPARPGQLSLRHLASR